MTTAEATATGMLVVCLLLAYLCVWQALRIDELENKQHDEMDQSRLHEARRPEPR